MKTIDGKQWLEVNYGDLPAMMAKQLLAEVGYNHQYLRKLHVSELMKLVQKRLGNLIELPGAAAGAWYKGFGPIYLTDKDVEKFDPVRYQDKLKHVADGWWTLQLSFRNR